MKQHHNIYQEITDKIVEALEAGVGPWTRPWSAGSCELGPYRNAVTNRPYRGINIMLLNLAAMFRGFTDHRWLTFKQARELGGSVRKGERGTQVVFWKFIKLKESDESEVAPEEPAGDLQNDYPEERLIPFAKSYTVFNVQQCKDLSLAMPEDGGVVIRPEDENPLAEKIMRLAMVQHGGNRAYFSPTLDYIGMPPKDFFETMHHYYSTGLHEMTHWTGHPARLARTFGRFGDHNYAFEELVAEIGAAFLGSLVGGPFEDMRHPEYINDWLSVLRGDKKAIFTAASHAQKAADFIFDKAGISAEEEDLPVAA